MRKKVHIVCVLLLVSYCSFSQGVGIGIATPDASGALDISATNKGLLIPRMSLTAINAIINPARGLLVYDSSANQLMSNTGTPVAPNWQPVGSGSDWKLTGNSSINPITQFIGTTDNQPLRFRVNNLRVGELHPATGNIFWGQGAGQNNTIGFSNIAIGREALKLNTDKVRLVAIGDSALFNNQGNFNTAIGSRALFNNSTGFNNTAVGTESHKSNQTGFKNTAIGAFSLMNNVTGNQNTAIGDLSLFANDRGSFNVAVGDQALGQNNGNSNTAAGQNAMFVNTIGFRNTALGNNAMAANTEGNQNTALGAFAMNDNTVGGNNTAVGHNALAGSFGSSNNTAVGFNSGTGSPRLGFNNTLIGAETSVTLADAFNAVALGHQAVCTGSNQVRLGNTFTQSIGGKVGFSTLSDGRFKRNILESVKGIEFIMKLRPVMYQLDLEELTAKLYPGKKSDELSKGNTAGNDRAVYSGFVAQEVEQAAQAAGYDFSGIDKPKNENDIYGLRYADFVVPMVKAMQEQQQMIQDLRKQNSDLQKRVLDLENFKR